MSLVAGKVAVSVGQQAYKHKNKIIIAVGAFFLVVIMGVGGMFSVGNNGLSENVSEEVLAWRPVVVEQANKYEIPEYVDVILAIMMVESGGKGLDIMQSSESLGLPPNAITDPVVSIAVGVKHLAGVVKDAQSKGLDFWTPIQSYNYGGGFNQYVAKHGGQYSFAIASDFALTKSGGRKVNYSNPVADFNKNWRYQYGNMYYVLLVQQYLTSNSDIGNSDASELGSENYKKLMSEVRKYEGWPYAWGGASPKGGFDCSGLLQYNYKLIGINLPRTAVEQYNATVRINDPKPGDLVFFKGTYGGPNHISHVGIYIDEKTMYNSASSGIGYADWSSGYWGKHFAGFGRIKK